MAVWARDEVYEWEVTEEWTVSQVRVSVEDGGRRVCLRKGRRQKPEGLDEREEREAGDQRAERGGGRKGGTHLLGGYSP